MIPLLIVVTLLSMAACHTIAGLRSANQLKWLLIGLLFGPFAIPFAFFAKPTRIPRQDSDSGESEPD